MATDLKTNQKGLVTKGKVTQVVERKTVGGWKGGNQTGGKTQEQGRLTMAEVMNAEFSFSSVYRRNNKTKKPFAWLNFPADMLEQYDLGVDGDGKPQTSLLVNFSKQGKAILEETGDRISKSRHELVEFLAPSEEDEDVLETHFLIIATGEGLGSSTGEFAD